MKPIEKRKNITIHPGLALFSFPIKYLLNIILLSQNDDESQTDLNPVELTWNDSLAERTIYNNSNKIIACLSCDNVIKRVMTVEYSLDGSSFVALNGGPLFHFSEAVSFIINCADQEEADFSGCNSLKMVILRLNNVGG